MLFLGSGGYVLSRYAEFVWPQSHIVMAAADPVGAAGVRRSLGLDRMAIEPVRMDAGACLSSLSARLKQNTLPQRFDLICNQPDHPLALPANLVTKQFNDNVSALLADNGVYILSIVDAADGGAFLGSLVSTLMQTFPHVRVIARSASHPSAVEDFVVLAAKRPLDVTGSLTSNAESPAFRVLEMAQVDRIRQLCSGLILTDERASIRSLLAPVVQAAAPAQLARKWLRRATLLDSQGQSESSETLYRQIASTEAPARGEAHAAIGRRYLSKGQTSKAAESLLAALKCAVEGGASPARVAGIRADLAGALKKVNESAQARQQMAEAIKEFQTEVREHPQSAVAWERLGDACIFQENWRDASDALTHCVELEPDYLTHYDKLARTLEAQLRYEEAIKVVRSQIALLKKSGRNEAATQQRDYLEVLEYKRVK